ncbi:MAG: ABC transporter ATP-binding protein [Lachnospiraceae bacterium]|nr:ABC transporter ATP-binding protein [Lachnospiraceae bacterium]
MQIDMTNTITEQKPAMEVKGLSFAYGSNKVLQNISLQIEKGKITTIMGANGCGKSTLFSLMTRNLNPGKGKVLLHGKNIQSMKLMDMAKKVSIVHQYNSAMDDITVEKLVSYGRTPYMKLMATESEEDKQIIDWALEVTNLNKYRDREVGKLSGGQRQRVWIAMALAQNTKILFLDEPTTYLDIRYQIEILELIKKLNRDYKITIIMVLHDINQAIHFSDHVIGLSEGKVIVEGRPSEVISTESIQKLYGIRLNVATVEGQKFVLTV